VPIKPLQQLVALRRGNLRLTQLHRTGAAVAAYGAFRSAMSKLGLQVVAKTFYSPIPDLASLPRDVWERRSDLAGIQFDLKPQFALLERNLAPFVAELELPREPVADLYLDNPSYGPGDAETLYAVVRHFKPARIVELGSGFTTLLMGRAVQANAADSKPVELRVFDPYPGVAGAETPGVSEFHSIAAQDVPLEVFEAIVAGDMLVVDTTHTVKLGGDVNRIVLEVLPRLQPGVIVHFHDIFLPYEYPREWPERFGLFWSEQYLLQAFLALNNSYEVLLGLQALVRADPKRIQATIPSLTEGGCPAAFWIRRVR
jgi:Methyltransferase domain